METSSDWSANRRSRIVLVIILSAFAIVCLGVIYYAGDLAELQDVISARETATALSGISDPDQLDQALKQYPSNKVLRLVALAKRDSLEIDAAARKLLAETEPKGLLKLTDLGGPGRTDLDAFRRNLKTAQNNTATVQSRYTALVGTERDRLVNEARALNVGDETISAFTAMLDEQHAEMIALTSKMSNARADYYNAYEKCATVLISEVGRYRVTNGQFIFPFQSTANAYNTASVAMAAAAKRMTDLEDERTRLMQSRLSRWKAFVAG